MNVSTENGINQTIIQSAVAKYTSKSGPGVGCDGDNAGVGSNKCVTNITLVEVSLFPWQ